MRLQITWGIVGYTSQPNSTSSDFTTQQIPLVQILLISLKIHTTGICYSGDRTSRLNIWIIFRNSGHSAKVGHRSFPSSSLRWHYQTGSSRKSRAYIYCIVAQRALRYTAVLHTLHCKNILDTSQNQLVAFQVFPIGT